MGEVLKVRFETSAEFDGNGSREVMANVDALVRKDRRWIRSDVSGGFGIRWLAGDCQAEHSSATNKPGELQATRISCVVAWVDIGLD